MPSSKGRSCASERNPFPVQYRFAFGFEDGKMRGRYGPWIVRGRKGHSIFHETDWLDVDSKAEDRLR